MYRLALKLLYVIALAFLLLPLSLYSDVFSKTQHSNHLIDTLFAEGFNRFKGREEIQGFDSGDFFQKEEEETMYFKYFQIVWKDAYLNERDMDLCDIEVSYRFLDNKKIKVWIELPSSESIVCNMFSAVQVTH